jgi:tRNA (cmo5U34)-methyltransferase
MHFLPDDGAKAAFLAGIAARLGPGAPYVHVDIHGDRASAAFQHGLATWRAFQLAHGTPPDEVEEFFRLRFPKTNPIPVERTEQLLRDAGFEVEARPFTVLVFGAWLCRRR